jgi:hypothetical protein
VVHGLRLTALAQGQGEEDGGGQAGGVVEGIGAAGVEAAGRDESVLADLGDGAIGDGCEGQRVGAGLARMESTVLPLPE